MNSLGFQWSEPLDTYVSFTRLELQPLSHAATEHSSFLDISVTRTRVISGPVARADERTHRPTQSADCAGRGERTAAAAAAEADGWRGVAMYRWSDCVIPGDELR